MIADALARGRRTLALAFVGSHTVHLVAVVTHFAIDTVPAMPTNLPSAIVGSGGSLAIIYLVSYSFEPSAAVLGRFVPADVGAAALRVLAWRVRRRRTAGAS